MSVTNGLRFLTSKWKTWFRSLDINADGAITPLDLEINTRRFIDVQKLPPDEAKSLAQLNTIRWDAFIFRGMKNPTITEADFIKHLTDSYEKDPEELKKFFHHASVSLFQFADVNKDGMMSVTDLGNLFKAYGTNNKVFVRKLHRNLRPNDKNLVSIKTASEEYVDYLIGDDEKKYNAIWDAYEEASPRGS